MLIIDFNMMMIASAMSQRIDHVDEGLLRHLVLNSILNARKKFQDHETVLACDSGTFWRRNIYPHYKGNRKSNREKMTFDWPSFFRYLDIIKGELKEVFPYKVIQLENAEADDIIGVLALNAKEPIIIYAEDQDFHQLMRNPNVSLYKPRKKVHVKEKPLHEIEYELFHKICSGDRGDHIPNVFSSLDSFVTGERQKPATTKRIDELFQNGLGAGDILERFKTNKSLIDLRDIPKEIQAKVIEEYQKPPLGSKGKIMTYLTTKQLNKMGTNFLADINTF